MTSVTVVKYLVAEDFISSLTCLIQCILNYQSGQLYGYRIGCMFEGWQVGFFISITGYSLAMISYVVRVNITSNTRVRWNKDWFIFKAHILFWISGAVFATLSAIWPGNSRLNSSGTYCLAAFEKLYGALFFFGTAVFPTVLFLISQYLWIYLCVLESRQNVNTDAIKDHSDSSSPTSAAMSRTNSSNDIDFVVESGTPTAVPKSLFEKNIKLARQLGSLVLVYFVCYTPFLASAMYEWITGTYAPPFFDFTGVLVHIASVANPIMYIWTSRHAKQEILIICNNFYKYFNHVKS